MNTKGMILHLALLASSTLLAVQAEQMDADVEAGSELQSPVQSFVHRSYYSNASVKNIKSYVKREGQTPILHGPQMEFYADGKLKAQGQMSMGMRHGQWVFVDELGDRTEGLYIDNSKAGTWKKIDANGKTVREEQYRENRLHGKATSFHPNGTESKVQSYVKGQKQGKEQMRLSNGTLVLEQSWLKDKLHGSYQQWSPSGQLLVSGQYLVGIPVGEWEWRDVNGELVRQLDMKSGTGVHAEYALSADLDADGQRRLQLVLFRETEYVDGKREGLTREYFPNGNTAQELYFSKGKPHGTHKEWYDNGSLKTQGTYAQGFPTGVTKHYRQVLGSGSTTSVLSKEELWLEDGVEAQVSEFHDNGKVAAEYRLTRGLKNGPYQEMYSNGQTRQEGNFSYGMKSGSWKEYFPSGQVAAIKNYQSDQVHGSIKLFHQSKAGQEPIVKIEGQYLRGHEDGKWTERDSKGSVITVQNYSFGALDGLYSSFWSSGLIGESALTRKEEGHYSNGKKEGEWKQWHQNGNIRSIVTFQNGVEEGLMEEWYDQAVAGKPALRMRGQMRNGQREGEWVVLFPNGKLELHQQFFKGQLHGRAQHYSPDNKLISDLSFAEGKRNGECRYFHKNGNLKSITQASEGHLDGPFEVYHENGKRSAMGEYRMGIPMGKWQWFGEDGKSVIAESRFTNGSGVMYSFFPNGTKKKETQFVNGIRHGEQRSWYANGQLQTEAEYNQGYLTGVYRDFHANGNLHRQSHWSDDRLDGTAMTWYDNKSEKRQQVFVNDVLHGEEVEWHSNGVVKTRGSWNQGTRNGVWSWYDQEGNLAFQLDYNEGVVEGTTAGSSEDLSQLDLSEELDEHS